jgi:hypothetical protein
MHLRASKRVQSRRIKISRVHSTWCALFSISVAGYPEGHAVVITFMVEEVSGDTPEKHSRRMTQSEGARSSINLESGAV